MIVVGVHAEADCVGVCVIHRPSAHPLRGHTLGYDKDKKSFYRVCGCGNVHQDPDERTHWLRKLEKSAGDSDTGKALEMLASWFCPECDCDCCQKTE